MVGYPAIFVSAIKIIGFDLFLFEIY